MNIEHDDEEEKIPEVTPETIIEDEEPSAYQPAEGLPYRPELSNLSKMYQTWFLDYASYVILERAVPHIDDGLKPVQRRILYNLKRMDSGKLIKVANIVGETMKYHPHGDASINDALVQLGQKGFLIDTQGNWGNISLVTPLLRADTSRRSSRRSPTKLSTATASPRGRRPTTARLMSP